MSAPVYPEVQPAREDAVGHTRSVLSEVAAERLRQVEVEGYTIVSDDAQTAGELARGAGAYALDAAGQHSGAIFWPFPYLQWKPVDRRQSLIKAAALAVAEIERIDRAAPAGTVAS